MRFARLLDCGRQRISWPHRGTWTAILPPVSMDIARMPAASDRQPDRAHGDLFAEHLREHGSRYFRQLAGRPAVRLVRWDDRPFSALYTYELEHRAHSFGVVVKVSRHRPPRVRRDRRPKETRPVPSRLSPDEQFEMESVSLRIVEEHFTRLADGRFGWIRVLATLPEHRAIIMERVRQPSLLELSVSWRRMPGRWPSGGLEQAFEHAGAWLRAYHAVVPPPNVAPVRPEKWLSDLRGVVEFLTRTVGHADLLSRALATAEARSGSGLESAPAGLRHGDFALRNILVQDLERITVLDIMARWQAPIYEDIGYLVAGLRTTTPQLLGGGLLANGARIERYERSFHHGYAGTDSVPWQAVRLFELQALLDRWASKSSYPQVGHLPTVVTAPLIDRAFARRVAVVTRELA